MSERESIQRNLAGKEPLLHASEEGEFAGALGARLAASVTCPDAVWKTAMEQVGRVQQRERRMLVFRRAAVVMMASAAAILLAAGGYFYSQSTPPQRPLFLTLDEHTIAGLEAKAEVSDGVSVRALLHDMSLPVTLDPNNTLVGEGGPCRLIGARKEHFGQEQAVEVLFDYMGKPAILVIAPRTGAIAKEIDRKYSGSKGMYAARSIGDVWVAAVGIAETETEYRPDDLLVLVSDPPSPATVTESSTAAPSADETSSMMEGIVPQEEPAHDSSPPVLEPITPESEAVPHAPVDTTVPEEVKQII